MDKKIKGLTVEIGGNASKLQKACEQSEKAIRSVDKELKQVDKSLKLDPKNIQLIAQKQTLLAEKSNATAEKLGILKDLQKELKKTGADATNPEAFRALTREISNTNSSLGRTGEIFSALPPKIQSVVTVAKTIGTVGKTAGKVLLKTSEYSLKAASCVGKFALEFGKIEVKAVEEAGKAFKAYAETATKAGTEALSAIGQGFETYITSATKLGTGIVKSSVEIGLDYDKQMSKVKAISQANDEQFAKLKDTARQMGATTMYSATEAGQALEYMALAGWKVDDMTGHVNEVLNLASASGLDLGTTSDIVTDYLTAFGKTAEDTGHFTDVLAYTMANSNTTTDMLGEAYKKCAATATSMGFSMEDTTAAIASMANAGIKGEMAGTSLNALMTRLATNTGDCETALNDYGVSIYDSQGNMKSLSTILGDISGIWGDLTDKERNNLSKAIAGTKQYASLQTVMSACTEQAKEGGKSFYDYADALHNCKGTAKEMAKTMTDNLAGDITILKSNIQETALSINDKLSPALRTIVQGANDVVTELNKNGLGKALTKFGSFAKDVSDTMIKGFAKEIPNLLGGFNDIIFSIADVVVENLPTITGTILPATIKGFTDLIKEFTQYIPQMQPYISTVVTSIFTSAITSLNTVLDAVAPALEEFVSNSLPNLISLLNSYITAFLPTMIENFNSIILSIADGIIQFLPTFVEVILPDLMTGFNNLISGLCLYIPELIPMIVDAGVILLNGLIDSVVLVADAIQPEIPLIITSICDVIEKNFPTILDTGFSLLVNLLDGLSDNTEEIRTTIDIIIPKFVGAVTDNLPKIIDSGLDIIIALANGVLDNLDKIVTAVPEIITTISGEFVKRLPDLLGIGANIIAGIVDGIKNFDFIDSIYQVGSNLVQALKDFFGIHSPSRLLRDKIGINLAKGIGVGFNDEIQNVNKSMANAVKTDFISNVKLKTASESLNHLKNSNDTINVSINIDNFNNNTDEDIKTLTQKISRQLAQDIKRKGAVFV